MKIVNLTPHAVYIMNDANEIIMTIPPSGTIARAAEEKQVVGHITIGNVSVPIHEKTFGEISGLPSPEPDTIYIVSALVAQAVPDRDDVFIPDDTVRDDQGRIIGCRALARV